jgi:hypothetical protein
MKKSITASGPSRLSITFNLAKPGVLSVRIFEKGKDHTVYFDRKYGSEQEPAKGKFTLDFPFPTPFQRVGIDVSGSTVKAQILDIQALSLVSRNPDVKPTTRDFIRFAQEFAQSAGYVQPATYGSDCGKFAISYLPVIRDYKTQRVIPTPARINHHTGLIEASRKDFPKLTVTNRMMILLHEYVHYANDTIDETECDLLSVKTCLDLGYSKIECLYAISKLFMYNTADDPKLRAEQEKRVTVLKAFIDQYQTSN